MAKSQTFGWEIKVDCVWGSKFKSPIKKMDTPPNIPPYVMKSLSLVKQSKTKVRIFSKVVPHNQMLLLKFASLNDRDFLYVAEMNSNAWMTYNAMKEYEYFCNRKGADENSTGKSLLTPELFQEVIDMGNEPGPYLNFALYSLMRSSEMSFLENERRYFKQNPDG
jgi:hypothetical protein